MPMLTPSSKLLLAHTKRKFLIDSRRLSAMCSARSCGQCGSSTPSSSPPRRARMSLSRICAGSSLASSCSSRSPALWPQVSLTTLNWSRSRYSSAWTWPSCLALCSAAAMAVSNSRRLIRPVSASCVAFHDSCLLSLRSWLTSRNTTTVPSSSPSSDQIGAADSSTASWPPSRMTSRLDVAILMVWRSRRHFSATCSGPGPPASSISCSVAPMSRPRAGPAGQVLGDAVHEFGLAVAVGGDDALADRAQRRLGQLALAQQAQLVVLAGRDVPDDAQRVAGHAGRVVKHLGLGGQPVQRAVRPQHPVFDLVAGAQVDAGLHGVEQQRAVVAVYAQQEVAERLAPQFRRQSQQHRAGCVPFDGAERNPAVGQLGIPDPHARRVQRQMQALLFSLLVHEAPVPSIDRYRLERHGGKKFPAGLV